MAATDPPDSPAPPRREVVLGMNAKVWRAVADEPRVAQRFSARLGHSELASFAFTPQDRVWVFAYSRVPAHNSAMIRHLAHAGVAEVVYLSSSSVIVNERSACYEYPRVKHLAEQEVRALPLGRVLTLGLVYGQPHELPGGDNIATSHARLAAFMLAPHWPEEGGTGRRLFERIRRPFKHHLDAGLFSLYGMLMQLAERRPCLLRPLDLLLRGMGVRWYGYTYLSNRLWISKTSS